MTLVDLAGSLTHVQERRKQILKIFVYNLLKHRSGSALQGDGESLL